MITSLYVALLGALFVQISLATIMGRRKYQISLGVGPNNEILHLVSAHNNFISYTPFFLISLFMLEANNFYSIAIHLLGISFVIGRVLHFSYMKNQDKSFKKRVLGMKLTLWSLIITSVLNLVVFARVLISKF